MDRREVITFGLTAIMGLAVWLGITVVSGEEEAWDSHLFFVVGLPLMVFASGVAGYIAPERFLIWGIAVVSLQPVALLLHSSVLGPLFLVGLFTFGVFAGVCMLSAWVGATLGRKMKRT